MTSLAFNGFVQIVIDSEVVIPNVHRVISSEVLSKLKALATHQDPTFFKDKRMGRFRKGDGKIITWKYAEEDHAMLRLPRGLFSKIRDVLRDNGYRIHVSDRRVDKVVDTELFPEYKHLEPATKNDAIELWDYQLDLMAAIEKSENCLVRGGCGCGKTEVGLNEFKKLNRNTLVVVWSKNVFDGWVKRACKRFGLKEKDIGMIISGRKLRLKPLTIALQQSLYSKLQDKDFRREATEFFSVVIADEVQGFAAPTLFGSIEPFPARYRIGISEDETRKDQKEFLIYDLFGEVKEDISTEYLESIGVIHRVPIFVIPTELRCDKYENPDFRCNAPPWKKCGAIYPNNQMVKLVEMTPTPRYRQMVEGDDCLNPECSGKVVQIKDYDSLLKQALMADEYRMDLIRWVAGYEHDEGHSIAIFSDRVEYCRSLSDHLRHGDIRNGLIVGDVEYKTQRREVVDHLFSGEVRVVLGTMTIYQGFDYPPLDRGIVAIPKGSNKQLLSQQIGRLRRPEWYCRKCGEKVGQTKEDVVNGTCPSTCPHCGSFHKTDAKLYYIWDRHIFPRHLSNIARWFKDVYVLSEDNSWVTYKEYKG